MYDHRPFRRPASAVVLPSLLVCVLALGCGGGSSSPEQSVQQAGGDFSPVIAQIGDVKITRSYFDFRYDNLSPSDKARYTGEGWEQRYLDELIEEMIVTEIADREQYDLVRETEWRLDMARRAILYRAYIERNFREQIEISEQELLDYYEQNKDTFRSLGRAFGHVIVTSTEQKIREAWAELQAETPFPAVAAKYSEEETTAQDGGSIGWFNRDGFVLGLGFNEEFTRVAFEMEAHSMREPVLIGDKWYIIKIGARVDDEPLPFEEVRERIARHLTPVVARERFDAFLREKRAELGVEGFGQFRGETRTADQLYQLAAESSNTHARIDFYEKLVDLYPDHERADDSLFMLGFLNSEEFGDQAAAMRAFRRLEREYPSSEFVEQARWMMQNLGGFTGLRGGNTPVDAEDAANRLRQRQ